MCIHTILMEEGDCLVQLPGVGNDVFGALTEQTLLNYRRIAFIFAVNSKLPHSLL